MYELVGSQGLFSIKQDGNLGEILVAGNIDYEKNKTFTFYVSHNSCKTLEDNDI